MASALAAIWGNRYTQTYQVWGKSVVMRALDNDEVQLINDLVGALPPAHQMQALAIATVAAHVVSVDGRSFDGLTSEDKLTPEALQARLMEIQNHWPDPLTALLYGKITEPDGLQQTYQRMAQELTDPN